MMDGEMSKYFGDGIMKSQYQDKNRGCQQLRAWHDAMEWIDHLAVKESNFVCG